MKTPAATQPKTKRLKTPDATFAAIVKTPVFPKTLHQFRPDPKVAATPKPPKPPKPPKRDNTFSQSRDVREDRGTREMKTATKNQTNHAG